MKAGRALAAGIVAAVAMALTTPRAAQAETLNIYSWADYIPAEVLAAFTKETGIDVEVTPYDSVEIPETKLLTGSSGFDLVMTAAFQVPQLITAQALMELDHGRIPNITNLDPAFLKEKLSKIDDGTRFSIPYDWGLTTIAVDVDKVKAILGDDAPLDTLSLLFDPAYAAKLQSCGIGMLDSASDVMGLAMLYNGVQDLFHATDADLEHAAATISAVRPYVKYFDNSRYSQDLATGELCISMAWSSDVVRAGFDVADTGHPANLEVILGREGALLWADHLVVPKDAPHPDAALAFLDFLMRGESAGAVTNTILVATPNIKGRAFVAPPLLSNQGIFPPQGWMSKLSPADTFGADLQRSMTRFYTKAKTGT